MKKLIIIGLAGVGAAYLAVEIWRERQGLRDEIKVVHESTMRGIRRADERIDDVQRERGLINDRLSVLTKRVDDLERKHSRDNPYYYGAEADEG